MEVILDTPETTDDGGLDSAIDAAWGGEEEDQVDDPIEEIQPNEVVENSPAESEVEEGEQESFTNLDPEKLPDEVKPFYKSLQAAFTKKRQEDSSRVSELEKKLDDAAKAKQEIDEVNSLIAKAQQGDQNAFNQLMRKQANAVESEEDRVRRIVQQEREEVFYKEAQADYPKLDKRVDELSPDYDPVLDKWLRSHMADSLDGHWEREGTSIGFDYKTAAKSLLEKWDKYLIEKNTAYLKRQSELAKKKSADSSKLAPKTTGTNVSSNESMDLDDAISAALDQVS